MYYPLSSEKQPAHKGCLAYFGVSVNSSKIVIPTTGVILEEETMTRKPLDAGLGNGMKGHMIFPSSSNPTFTGLSALLRESWEMRLCAVFI